MLASVACTTPADHFDRVWNQNTKLSACTLNAFNSRDSSGFYNALAGVDGVVASLDDCEALSENDSLFFYVRQSSLFTSRFLRCHASVILSGADPDLASVKKEYLDSADAINRKINKAAIDFMNEYDLNVSVQ